MNIVSKTADAIDLAMREARGILDNETREALGAAAVGAIRSHVAEDDQCAQRVVRFTSLRQSASETPTAFVRRIVGAYLDEAIE